MKTHRHIITTPVITLTLAVSLSALATADASIQTSGKTSQTSDSMSSADVAAQIRDLYNEAGELLAAADSHDSAKLEIVTQTLKIAKQKCDMISADEHIKIVEQLINAAKKDDIPAQLVLFCLYGEGSKGVPKDEKEARHWLRKAALNGCKSAREVLEIGTSSSSAQTDTEDEIALGIIYYQGRGVEKDVDEAVSYFLRAAQHGDSKGLLLMGLAATKEGNAAAQCYLGVFLDKGKLVPQDHEKAVKWFRMAAEQDHALGQLMLGLAYMDNDHGVQADPRKGLQLIRRAADKNEPMALFALGRIYYEGYGVLPDKTEGLRLIKEASEKGCLMATDYLMRLRLRGGK